MSELKTSLFGYSKKSVDKIIEDIKAETQQSLQRERETHEKQISEYQSRLKSMEMELKVTQRKLEPVLQENEELKNRNVAMNDDYSDAINNYNEMRRDIMAYRAMLKSKNHEIETLRAKLNQSEVRYDSFIRASQQASADMVHSGSVFDEKITILKDCLSQMSQICADTETVFNEVYHSIANIILFEFSNETQSDQGNPPGNKAAL